MAYIRRDQDERLNFLSGLMPRMGARGGKPFRDLAPDVSSQPFFGFPGGRLGWTQWRQMGAPDSFDPGVASAQASPLQPQSSVASEPGFSGAPTPVVSPLGQNMVTLPADQARHFRLAPAPPPIVSQQPTSNQPWSAL